MTFASRLLGLCRDIVIARAFGAGPLTDAFFAAFRLPNMLRRFTAEGALTQAFVPVYSEKRRQNVDDASALAGETAVFLASLLLLVSLLCIALAPWIMTALAPGLSAATTAVDLFRIVFPYIIFISLVALFAGLLNATHRFHTAAAAPLLLNISMIIATIWGAPFFQQPIFALAWGVAIGGVAQLLWIVIHVKRAGLWPQLVLRWWPSTAVRRVLRLMCHSALGASAAQFNVLINLFIASFLSAGSISWLYYADRLMELPVGLLGATLATIVLPGLSANTEQSAAFSALLDLALRLIVFLALPAAVGLACLSLPLVTTLFMHGEFSVTDALRTEQAVLAYSVGIFGLVAVRPLAAAFFSRQDARIPVRSALIALAATQLLNLVFVVGLEWGHAGLALSISLAACLNATILFIILRNRGWYTPSPGWRLFLIQTAVALLVMTVLLITLLPSTDYWLAAKSLQRVTFLGAYVVGAIIVYFGVAWLAGLRLAAFRQQA